MSTEFLSSMISKGVDRFELDLCNQKYQCSNFGQKKCGKINNPKYRMRKGDRFNDRWIDHRCIQYSGSDI